MRLRLVERFRVRYMDSCVRCPVADRSQFLLFQFQQVQLEIGPTSLVELDVARQTVQTDRVDEVVQGQAVVPRVFQLARQIPRSQDVARLGCH